MKNKSKKHLFLSLVALVISLTGAALLFNQMSKRNFALHLQHDLDAYFSSREHQQGQSVYYEFLRQGASRVGVADPKYYLWTNLLEAGQIKEEGAMRIAQVTSEQFVVTHYLSLAELRKNPQLIEQIFPQSVAAKIRTHM